MVRAFLGLGSNLGDRVTHLQTAVAAIPDVVAVSPVYETDPVGGPEQGAYLNLVVELDTDRSPRDLLEVCRERERAAQRERKERWGPRTLDVDVLWVEGAVVDEPDPTPLGSPLRRGAPRRPGARPGDRSSARGGRR
jgi:2-amino-4-hydroxy-6-hydroxymethyldihydropteridine diphosphokinase